MGMFDYIVCDYPIDAPEWAKAEGFQTKALENKLLTYRITADGKLFNIDDKALVPFSGLIEFYHSNVVATGPGIYTADGDWAHYLTFEALFSEGTLQWIKKTEDRREPAVKFTSWNPPEDQMATPEQQTAMRERRRESLIGKTVIVWWGGQERGYPAVVAAENERFLVMEANGRYEIMDRTDRDRLFFDSLEEGQRYKDERKAKWEAGRLEFEAEVARRLEVEMARREAEKK